MNSPFRQKEKKSKAEPQEGEISPTHYPDGPIITIIMKIVLAKENVICYSN
jgi:hypothetical protein